MQPYPVRIPTSYFIVRRMTLEFLGKTAEDKYCEGRLAPADIKMQDKASIINNVLLAGEWRNGPWE